MMKSETISIYGAARVSLVMSFVLSMMDPVDCVWSSYLTLFRIISSSMGGSSSSREASKSSALGTTYGHRFFLDLNWLHD
jgi:hypothetical protein